MICPLCNHTSQFFHKDKHRSFYQCKNCLGIFTPTASLPDIEAEKHRYMLHKNTIEDLGYQAFVSPITQAILQNHPSSENGLDFGAGPGPVVTYMLEKEGYSIELYDPIFHNNPETFQKLYNFIICCEVIEHFHSPAKEFKLLHKLLKLKGKLYCMTDVFTDDTNFETWYYKNDFTHVFFYHPHTLKWIQNAFGFSSVQIDNRLITFRR